MNQIFFFYFQNSSEKVKVENNEIQTFFGAQISNSSWKSHFT